MSSGLSTSDGTDASSDLAGISAAAEDLNGEAEQNEDNASVAGDEDDVNQISSELSKYQNVYEQTFDKIQIPGDVLQDTSEALQTFITTQSNSRETAGDAIFNAIFEAAPSLQTMFKSPRPVMALKFCSALVALINAAPKPGALKTAVETIGFQHLAGYLCGSPGLLLHLSNFSAMNRVVGGSGPAFPAVYAVGSVLDAPKTTDVHVPVPPAFGPPNMSAETAMWKALARAATERMEAEEHRVGKWPASALSLTRPDRKSAATLLQVGDSGKVGRAVLPPPDPAKVGPLAPLPSFGAGLGASLPELPPLGGPASAVGTTLPLYAGSYGGALGCGLNGLPLRHWSASYDVWQSATPPTDITEFPFAGDHSAGEDLALISSVPPSLLLMAAWLPPKKYRHSDFF